MTAGCHVGVGASRAASSAEVLALVRAALAEVGLTRPDLGTNAGAGTGANAGTATNTATGLDAGAGADTRTGTRAALRSGHAVAPRPAVGSGAIGFDADRFYAEGLPGVVALATVSGKERTPAVAGAAAELGLPVIAFAAAELACVMVPNPSEPARTALGTASVAEAAALLAAGPGAELALTKRKSAHATVAVALAAPAHDAAPAVSDTGTPSQHRTASQHRTPSPHGTTPAPRADAPLGPARRTTFSGERDVYPDGHDLRHHGDAEVGEGLVDLAVNVRAGTPPGWLAGLIGESLAGLAAYPDGRTARHAVAVRHGRTDAEVLLTAGAAEAFVLLARALRPRRAVVVHPQFTEPEAALRAAGHEVERVLLDASDGFRLDPGKVPADADLVVLGNPTNPTSVLHPAALVRELARPGRTLVVDEAFMDAVPGERESLAGPGGGTGGPDGVPGLVVLRSLTKTWGLAGLRVGYVLGAPELIADLADAQPLWAVSTPALAAVRACMSARALDEAAEAARQVTADRAYLVARLSELPEVRTAGDTPAAPFVLLRLPGAADVRVVLRELGYAVRRADTFPGLGPDWLRVAVRDRRTTDGFVNALSTALTSHPAR
jgi:histidinol-phosphate aminotransferase